MGKKIIIKKDIDVDAKDIIVNVGKVDIDIEIQKEKKQRHGHGLEIAGTDTDPDIGAADAADAAEADADADAAADVEVEALVKKVVHHNDGKKIKIKKKIDIDAKDIILNIGKVKIDIEKEKQHRKPHKPGKKPIKITTDPVDPIPSEDPSLAATTPLFEDFTPADEPSADEVVLGENATAAAITVQGGEHFDERGVLILTGPQIFSVTFKIVKEKVITITGSDLSVAGGMKHQPREAVTFIIRGVGFVPGGGLFSEISDMVDGTSKGGLFDFLEPRVFLGAIPLKVVRFTDTVILARFLDVEDQRRFEAGTLLARVKVLHVDIKRQEKKHGPGGDIGVLGGPDGFTTEVASVGGLVLPALGAIGGSITSGPVLGVVDGIGIDGKGKDGHGGDLGSSLLGLFAGLRFDTAVLAVSFSEKDASKIRGSFNTLFTDDFPLI